MEFQETKLVAGGRCGEIRFSNKDNIDTPACMLYTRGGAVPHLTNELVENFIDDCAGVHITLPTMWVWWQEEMVSNSSMKSISIVYFFIDLVKATFSSHYILATIIELYIICNC